MHTNPFTLLTGAVVPCLLIGCMSPPSATCGDLVSALKADGLNAAFEAAPAGFIAGCRANPLGARLWPKDQDPAHDAKIAAYCRISPVFRACFVCDRKSRPADAPADPEARSSYEACRDYLEPRDRAHVEAIWGPATGSGT